jgi:hypothetical protein
MGSFNGTGRDLLQMNWGYHSDLVCLAIAEFVQIANF